MQKSNISIIPPGKDVYGIRAEKTAYDGPYQYVAYRYELTPNGREYAYTHCLKRWKTLEIALVRYSIRGIVCFPLFGSVPDSISEDEMLQLIDTGFDSMLDLKGKKL